MGLVCAHLHYLRNENAGVPVDCRGVMWYQREKRAPGPVSERAEPQNSSRN
jgi:hypothetical protein